MYKFLPFLVCILLTMIIVSCSPLEPKEPDIVFDKTRFSEIHKYAQFANAVYKDTPMINQTLATHGYQLVKLGVVKSIDVQYFLANNPTTKAQIVAIRGTANLENALLDMKIKMASDKHAGINLHSGFATAAEGVYKQIRPHVNQNYTLYTVGHSLGGAVALILAIYLDIDKSNVGGVTTFGQPKVTDKAGATRFSDLPITRVVTEKDVVPLVPPIDPSVLSQPNIYWHLGEEIILFPETYYSTLDGKEAMLRSLTMLRTQLTTHELDAHRMINYVTLTEQMRSGAKNIPYRDRAQYIH